jgi:hypothetical protein
MLGASFTTPTSRRERERGVLEDLRREVGVEALLVGHGTSLVAAAGVLNAIDPASAEPGDDASPEPSSLQTALRYAFMNQVVRFLLRPWPRKSERDTADAEFRTRLSVAALSSSAVALEGDLRSLPASHRDWLRRCLPALGRECWAPDLWHEPDPQRLVVPLLGKRRALLAVNTSNDAVAIAPSLAGCGLWGPHHVFDFWAGRYLGVVEDTVPAAEIPSGGCRVLALTPVSSRPVVVGSNLHIGMGTLEVTNLREQGSSGVEMDLRLPGRREGELWVAPAAGRDAVAAAVRFENRGRVRLRW